MTVADEARYYGPPLSKRPPPLYIVLLLYVVISLQIYTPIPLGEIERLTDCGTEERLLGLLTHTTSPMHVNRR
jgi:hypothetical protein